MLQEGLTAKILLLNINQFTSVNCGSKSNGTDERINLILEPIMLLS